jgi:hypothetical protein
VHSDNSLVGDAGTRALCGAIDGNEPGAMVVGASLLLDGRRTWRCSLRAHRAYPQVECVAGIVISCHAARGTDACLMMGRLSASNE